MMGIGISRPTPVQAQAIPILLEGRHLLAAAPTGSGKTFAFLLPMVAVLRAPGKGFMRGLVVDPTRELAQQTIREANRLIEACKGKRFRVRLLDSLSLPSVGEGQSLPRVDVGVATPARLGALLREGRCHLRDTEVVVLDEADKLLDLGFTKQVDELMGYALQGDKKPQVSMFSATLNNRVSGLAESALVNPVHLSVGGAGGGVTASEDVSHRLVFCGGGGEHGKLVAIRQLLHEGAIRAPTLIFCQSRERAGELCSELVISGGVLADCIHADRTKAQRDKVIEAFRKGQIWVLICTDVLARGVDFKGIEVVLNYDVPLSAATYVHRVGRTGRAGFKGDAITLYTLQDVPILQSAVLPVMKQSGCAIPEWLEAAKADSLPRRRSRKELPAPKRKCIIAGDRDKLKPEKRQRVTKEDTPEQKKTDSDRLKSKLKSLRKKNHT